LAENWHRAGANPETTVRALMADSGIRSDLLDLYERELIPGFAAHGMEEEARDYVRTTIERFENPFLDHRLTDIIINHQQKIERRIVAFLAWSAAAGVPQPRLRAIAARHGFGEAGA
jgi:tagaturonate reductase